MKKSKTAKVTIYGDAAHNSSFYTLIGQLIAHAANNESLFLRILQSLLAGSKDSTNPIFFSLRTASARIDMVSALLQARINCDDTLTEYTACVKQFKNLSKTRNFYAHCMYNYDPQSLQLTFASGVKLDENTKIIKMQNKRFDLAAVNELNFTNAEFVKLNSRLWELIKKIDQFVGVEVQP